MISLTIALLTAALGGLALKEAWETKSWPLGFTGAALLGLATANFKSWLML
jgi:hypothetical protein